MTIMMMTDDDDNDDNDCFDYDDDDNFDDYDDYVCKGGWTCRDLCTKLAKGLTYEGAKS